MELKEKIGQLLIVGFHGAFPEDEGVQLLSAQIKQSAVGGIIQYGYNITAPDQVKTLNKHFLDVAEQAKLPPLFTTVDQEGGKVQRLLPKKGFQGFPSSEDVASLSDEDARKHYTDMADELKAHHFNWDFAPSVDMNVDGFRSPILGELDRTFGSDTKTIVHYASIMLDVFQEKGILNCIKHFPGHGSARKDSHQGFVDVSDHWVPEELEPFFKLTQRGGVDAVMTAHIYNKALDEKYPATLSKCTLQKLRKEGYEGVIISDDLHMSAIQEKYGFEEAAILALKAGNDMVIYSNNVMAAASIEGFKPDPYLPERFQKTILEAIRGGDLDEADINEAFERVMTLKSCLKKKVNEAH